MAPAQISPTNEPIVDPDMLYEIVDGKVVEMSELAFDASIASLLLVLLGLYVKANGIGRALRGVLFRTSPDRRNARRPSLVFMSAQRWPIGRPLPHAAVVEVFPDLAVEVIDPTILAIELREKLREYFDAGAEQVWEVYPTDGTIYVYESPKAVRIYGRGDILDGGDLLPGFGLAVSDLLPEPSPAD